MFQLRDDADLESAIARFYEARKPTAVLCHGTYALLERPPLGRLVPQRGPDDDRLHQRRGGLLRRGRRAPRHALPHRGRGPPRGANYIQAGLFNAFAVRDMNLITGQQQYSARSVAELVIQELGD